MYAIRKLGRIVLRAPGVFTLCAHVLVGAVAFARDVPEPRSVAADGPGLSKGNPLCAWRPADQPVHAAIKVMGCTAPPLKAGSYVAVAPIRTGFWPLDGDTPAVGDAGVCHLAEPQPEAAE